MTIITAKRASRLGGNTFPELGRGVAMEVKVETPVGAAEVLPPDRVLAQRRAGTACGDAGGSMIVSVFGIPDAIDNNTVIDEDVVDLAARTSTLAVSPALKACR